MDYALCVRREHQNDYIWPMSLETIDSLFCTYSKEEVLNIMKQADSVLKETDVNKLVIKKRVGNRYIEEKFTEIISDPFDLTYPLEYLPIEKGSPLGNILYNRLLPFKNRTKNEVFKKAIDALQESKERFLHIFSYLNYSEQRIIRSIINRNFNVREYYNKNNSTLLLTKEKNS